MDTDWVKQEIGGVVLPDERYRKNLATMVSSLNTGWDLSFSRALGESVRKSAWRLFSSGELDLQSGHRRASISRCDNEQVVLAIEDTTDVNYSSHVGKKGMGILGGQGRHVKGINIHTSMLIKESGEPLGIAYQRIWSPNANHQGTNRRQYAIEDKESYKWILALRTLNSLWENKTTHRVIKIADREADFYELYEHDRSQGVELLIRVQQKKRWLLHEGKPCQVKDVISNLVPLGFAEVLVRATKNTKERRATVGLYASPIALTVPSDQKYTKKIAPLAMNLVWLKEQNPPDEGSALEWILMTTLHIDNFENISKIVNYYTRRWVIERFHYILKQGLQIEKLQIDTLERLQNALQIYSIVAWHLLWIYKVGNQNSKAEAIDYFDKESIEILQLVSAKQIVSVADFILALASLAGFKSSKKQPFPGEKTLWLASQRFISIKSGFLKAKQFYGTG